MAKLEWDKTGERYLEYGNKNGVLYVQNNDGTYGSGVVWNGLTAVTESPDGAEPNDLYADDMKYASLRSAETFGGTIEAYQAPAEFDECDGMATPIAGVSLGQQKRKPFGFSYVTQVGNDTATDSDDGEKLHIWWNCTASPSERSYETVNDSPDAITFSWEIDTTPVPITGYKPLSTITIDSTKLDASGKIAYENLKDTLYGTASTDPTLPSPTEVLAMFSTVGYTVTNNLTHAENSSSAASVTPGGSYSATISPEDTYTLSSVTVTMGGVDVTSMAVTTSDSNKAISISAVTGNIVITAVATST